MPPVTGRCSPSEPQTVPTGMQGVRQQFINNVAGEITIVLMDSWRPGTRKQYDVYIRKWETFCSQEKSDPLHPNVNEVLKFLHNLHIKQLSYSPINSARSSLSNYLMGFHFSYSHFTVSNHPFWPLGQNPAGSNIY